jgi:integrase
MPSIWKHSEIGNQGKYWMAKYKTESGKWKNKSTRVPSSEKNRSKAMEVAQKWENDAQSIDHVALLEQHISNGSRQIAERVYPNKVKRTTVRAYMLHWLSGEERKVAPSTYTTYESQVTRFLAAIGAVADKPLTALMSDSLESHRQILEKEGGKKGKPLAIGTVNQHCKTISAALEDAYRKGVIVFNPAKSVDHAPKKSSEKKPFTEQDLRRILAKAEGEWRTAILFAIYTGARLGDCVGMEWENVKFFGKPSVTYTPEKQRRGSEKPMTVPIVSPLLDHLQSLASGIKGQPKGWITPTLKEGSPGGCKGLSFQFADIMCAAGVSQEKSPGQGGRSFSAKSFHSFRHTLTTMLAKSGTSEEVRRKVTGHKSTEVHRLYTHMDIDDQEKALSALPDFTAGA